MNLNTMDKLGYFELKDKIKNYCTSNLGKKLIDKLNPSTDIKVVERMLRDTSEAKSIILRQGNPPLSGLFDIEDSIEKIDMGTILNPSELISISDFLRACRSIKRFMLDQEYIALNLSNYARSIYEIEELEDEINTDIKNNRISSSTSKELSRIRRYIENTEIKIKEELNKFLSSAKNKDSIREFLITERGDTYTIPIKSEYKNKVEGRIVATSSTGVTVFVEPKSVQKSNSELLKLKEDEKNEEYQILSFLTGFVLSYIKEIKINLELMMEYDMIFAKAKYSIDIDGIEPKLNKNGYINLQKVYNPLIEKYVPLDFQIGKEFRCVTITGPNAGGKTIVLKTIGLLSLAVQSGIHIKGNIDCEFSVFENIFIDIGDNQSIENSLSTFSAHIRNISNIVNKSNERTLVLLDELGSGTDPKEGSTIAISILQELYRMGSIVISTSHYDRIKEFSEKHPHFKNASVEFNKETLTPLYKLVMGESGESNALWICERMNLKQSILNRARKILLGDEIILNEPLYYNCIREEKEKVENKFKEFKKGDTVDIINGKKNILVYDGVDEINNITLYVNKELVKINYRKVILRNKAEDLYPEGYSIDDLFLDYTEIKLEKDIKRGSKKAIKKIHKEIKNRKYKK